jgi:cell division transport system ATP-binding protein
MSFSTEPILSVSETSIMQEGRTILSEVNFDIQKGEFVYLIGRTGSGKSSLLKTFYADVKLYFGEIKIAGFSLKKMKRAEVPYLRRKIGIIFQDFQLLGDRSVNDNLHFVLRATGWSDSSKIKQRIADVLFRVGLSNKGTKFPYQLSGGEQQRVVIARALLNEPILLIADEPTGNLDPEVADGIMQLFQQINNAGTAILMATHNYELFKKYPGRVIKCQEGKVLESDTANYQDLAV